MGKEGLTGTEAGFPHDSAVPQPSSRRVDALPCAQTPLCAHGSPSTNLDDPSRTAESQRNPAPSLSGRLSPMCEPPPHPAPGQEPRGRSPRRSPRRPHPTPGQELFPPPPGRRPTNVPDRSRRGIRPISAKGAEVAGRWDGSGGRCARSPGRRARRLLPPPVGPPPGLQQPPGLRAPGGRPRPVPHRATPSAHHPALESLI